MSFRTILPFPWNFDFENYSPKFNEDSNELDQNSEEKFYKIENEQQNFTDNSWNSTGNFGNVNGAMEEFDYYSDHHYFEKFDNSSRDFSNRNITKTIITYNYDHKSNNTYDKGYIDDKNKNKTNVEITVCLFVKLKYIFGEQNVIWSIENYIVLSGE